MSLSDAAQDSGQTTPSVGTPIRIAAVLVALEGVALIAFAVVDLFSIDGDRLALGLTNAAFFAAYGAGLMLCARALLRLNSWCRAPILIAQVIELGLAWSFTGGDTTWLAVALAVPAAVVLVIVVSPSTSRAMFDGPVDG